jgi:hypothetical protein
VPNKELFRAPQNFPLFKCASTLSIPLFFFTGPYKGLFLNAIEFFSTPEFGQSLYFFTGRAVPERHTISFFQECQHVSQSLYFFFTGLNKGLFQNAPEFSFVQVRQHVS